MWWMTRLRVGSLALHAGDSLGALYVIGFILFTAEVGPHCLLIVPVYPTTMHA